MGEAVLVVVEVEEEDELASEPLVWPDIRAALGSSEMSPRGLLITITNQVSGSGLYKKKARFSVWMDSSGFFVNGLIKIV